MASTGNAQRHEIKMSDYPSLKVYHYAAGGSVLKDIWSDAAKTTPLAQPAVADANGFISFFADGIYRIVLKDSTDVLIPNGDMDDYKITADMATLFEANKGTVLPSADATNIGDLFMLFDVSDNILGLYGSDGTQYKALVTFTATGIQTFESVATKSHPWRDITHSDYGAQAGVASDQSASVQLAIDDIATDGDGVILVPMGRFQIDSSLDINNTSIKWKGFGSGVSVLVQTVDPSAPMLDYDTTDITDTFDVEGVGLETEVVSSSAAIDATWPTTASEDSLKTGSFKDVYIGPTAAASATAYFDNGIIIEDGKKMDFSDVFLRGHDSLDTVMVGVLLNGNTESTAFRNLKCHHMLTGLETTAAVVDTQVIAGQFKGQTNGILLGGCTNFGVGGATIFEKDTGSAVNWFGVKGDTTGFTCIGNIFINSGGGGTATGVYLDTTTGAITNSNHFNSLSTGIEYTVNCTASEIIGNYFQSCTTNIVNVNNNPIANNFPITWASVASATTVALDNSSNHWLLTGTTLTQNIPASWDGRILHIRFLTSISIADSTGNLRLTGAKSATINDTMELVYEATAGVWLEKNFSINNNTP